MYKRKGLTSYWIFGSGAEEKRLSWRCRCKASSYEAESGVKLPGKNVWREGEEETA